jgi:hypothetical protein
VSEHELNELQWLCRFERSATFRKVAGRIVNISSKRADQAVRPRADPAGVEDGLCVRDEMFMA